MTLCGADSQNNKSEDKLTWPLPLLVAFVWFSWQAFPWCFSDIAQLFGKIADNHHFPETGLCLASDPLLPWIRWGGSIYACCVQHQMLWNSGRLTGEMDDGWGPKQLLGTKSEVNGGQSDLSDWKGWQVRNKWILGVICAERKNVPWKLCEHLHVARPSWGVWKKRLGLTRNWSIFMLVWNDST